MATTTAKPSADSADVREKLSALMDDFSSLRSDVSALASSIGGLAADRGRELGDHALDEVQATAQAAGEKSKEAAAFLESTVNERPLTSLLVAMGAGFAIGKVLGRGRK